MTIADYQEEISFQSSAGAGSQGCPGNGIGCCATWRRGGKIFAPKKVRAV